MRSQPFLTVLMSVKNGGALLQPALESVLLQTVSDFRFLIINDGSTDGTKEKLGDWAKADSRIELIDYETSGGLAARLKEGVERVETDWIACMHADDISEPHRLEECRKLIQTDQVDLFGSWATLIDDQNINLGIKKVPQTDAEIRRLLWTNPFIHPTVCFRREAVLRCGNYDPRPTNREDLELWLRCAKGGLRFANIPEPLLRYRYGRGFVSNYSLRSHWRGTMGAWRGLRGIGAPAWQYAGTAYPLVARLIPAGCREWVVRYVRKHDPRKDATTSGHTTPVG